MKEEMLFGHPKYEVESLADTIQRAQEAQQSNSGLYQAAMKLLKRRQNSLSKILGAAMRKKK